jgi:hypothetical protein
MKLLFRLNCDKSIVSDLSIALIRFIFASESLSAFVAALGFWRIKSGVIFLFIDISVSFCIRP